MTEKKTTTLSFSFETLKAMKIHAAQREMSMSDLIEELWEIHQKKEIAPEINKKLVNAYKMKRPQDDMVYRYLSAAPDMIKDPHKWDIRDIEKAFKKLKDTYPEIGKKLKKLLEGERIKRGDPE